MGPTNPQLNPKESVKRDGYEYVNPVDGNHTHTLIFMHGNAHNATTFKYLFEPGGPLHFPSLKVVLPQAEKMLTLTGGTGFARSWYEVYYSIDYDKKQALLKRNDFQAILEKHYDRISQVDLSYNADKQLQLA